MDLYSELQAEAEAEVEAEAEMIRLMHWFTSKQADIETDIQSWMRVTFNHEGVLK
jgi:hypothetical protein